MPDASQPGNDPSIEDSEILYLRDLPSDVTSKDCPPGEYRPTSGAFRRDEALSVDLASKSTMELTCLRAGGAAFHVAVFTAAVARKQDCRVRRDPLLDNDAHAVVIGNHKYDTGAMSKSQMSQIAKQARIVCWDARFPRESYLGK